VLEKRVMALAEELRCLVCQNQTLADSNAPLAEDLRNQVREKMRAGKSDREVVDFLVERYGDFVLYRPPLKATTLLLWFGRSCCSLSDSRCCCAVSGGGVRRRTPRSATRTGSARQSCSRAASRDDPLRRPPRPARRRRAPVQSCRHSPAARLARASRATP